MLQHSRCDFVKAMSFACIECNIRGELFSIFAFQSHLCSPKVIPNAAHNELPALILIPTDPYEYSSLQSSTLSPKVPFSLSLHNHFVQSLYPFRPIFRTSIQGPDGLMCCSRKYRTKTQSFTHHQNPLHLFPSSALHPCELES